MLVCSVGQYSIHSFKGGRQSYKVPVHRQANELLRRVWQTPVCDGTWVLYVLDRHGGSVATAIAFKLINEPADPSMHLMLQLHIIATAPRYQRRGLMRWLLTAVRYIASIRQYSGAVTQPSVFVLSRLDTAKIWMQPVRTVRWSVLLSD